MNEADPPGRGASDRVPRRSVPTTDPALSRRVAGGPERLIEAVHEPVAARWVTFGATRVLVEPGVFPPQQDTLSVIDRCLDVLADRERPVIADLCTGSGVIALALAAAHSDAQIYAVDSSPAALRSARANAERLARRTRARIEVRAGDATDARTLADIAGGIDLVVANPPYLPDRSPAPPALAAAVGPAALHGGPDGLTVIRGIIAVAAAALRPDGWLVLEHAAGQQESVIALLTGTAAFGSVTGHRDHAGIPRLVTACRAPTRTRPPIPPEQSGL
jgi:release factor glutamine methyltransferase